MFYPYRVETLRPALILGAIELVVALLASNPNVRLLCLILLSGPLVWSILQILRRGRGVLIGVDTIELQASLLRRARVIAQRDVMAYTVTAGERLALVYSQARPTQPGDEPRPPRLRLFLTAALDDPQALLAALPLSDHSQSPSEAQGIHITQAQLREMLLWRRIRRGLFMLGGLFVGIPTLIILTLRLFTSLGLFIRH